MVDEHPVEDDKYRSRKFRLAFISFVVVTVCGITLAVVASVFLVAGIIEPEEWYRVLSLACYWWLFADGGILALYGGANVIEKWSLK